LPGLGLHVVNESLEKLNGWVRYESTTVQGFNLYSDLTS